jgi:hypothetical protein
MLWLALAAALAAQAAQPVVLARAYSHNDYEQPRALLDALDRGFFGVEADVHLRGTELFVAHTGGGVKPGRTLEALYLDPLLARVKAGGGRVYPGGPKGFLLLIDFKSDGEETYAALRERLAPYRSMLTRFRDGKTEPGAVTRRRWTATSPTWAMRTPRSTPRSAPTGARTSPGARAGWTTWSAASWRAAWSAPGLAAARCASTRSRTARRPGS